MKWPRERRARRSEGLGPREVCASLLGLVSSWQSRQGLLTPFWRRTLRSAVSLCSSRESPRRSEELAFATPNSAQVGGGVKELVKRQ